MGGKAERILEALDTGGYSLLAPKKPDTAPDPSLLVEQLEGLESVIGRAMHNADGDTGVRIYRAIKALGEAADLAVIQLEME